MSRKTARKSDCPLFGIPPCPGWDPRSCSLARGGLLLARPVAVERSIRRVFAELLEQQLVVLHRLPEVLRRAVAERARPGEAVAEAIVLDDLRVVDRNVGRALLEVVHRVAPVGHHGLD